MQRATSEASIREAKGGKLTALLSAVVPCVVSIIGMVVILAVDSNAVKIAVLVLVSLVQIAMVYHNIVELVEKDGMTSHSALSGVLDDDKSGRDLSSVMRLGADSDDEEDYDPVADLKAKAHAKRVSQVRNSTISDRRVSTLKMKVKEMESDGFHLGGIAEEVDIESVGARELRVDTGTDSSRSSSEMVKSTLKDFAKTQNEQDARRRAVILLRDLHAHSPINLDLITRADSRVLFLYRIRKHRAWFCLRMFAIILPIFMVMIEPPQNPAHDIYYQKQSIFKLWPRDKEWILVLLLSLCVSVSAIDQFIELRYLADCRGGVCGIFKALFSRKLHIRNKDGHITEYRSSNTNVRILNMFIITILVLDQLLRIGGTKYYFRVARPTLLITNVRAFHRIAKLIMKTCFKVKSLFIFLITCVCVFAILGVVLFGSCSSDDGNFNFAEEGVNASVAGDSSTVSEGDFADTLYAILTLFVLLSVDNLPDLIVKDYCDEPIRTTVYVGGFVVLIQMFIMNVLIVYFYEEYKKYNGAKFMEYMKLESNTVIRIFELLTEPENKCGSMRFSNGKSLRCDM